MKWEELPLADRALLMAAAVRNGYTDIRSIKAAYANFQNQRQQTGNRYDDGGDIDNDDVEVVNVLDEHPVWKALGNIDYKTVADPEFTREKTGAGSIEYFSAEEPEGITYNNGYHRDHPMPGKDVILYNPDENDEQDIRLDALHIMPKDPTYDALNSLYRDASYTAHDDNYQNAERGWKVDRGAQSLNNTVERALNGPNAAEFVVIDPFIQYFNNEADGTLRSLLMEGDEEYRASKRYWPNKEDVRQWNAHLMPHVNRIEQYLKTGKRPADILPELTVTNQKAYGGNLFKTGGNKGKKKGITQQELQRRKNYYRQQLIIRGLRGALLEAVLANMEVESTFDPGAHNDASGARGLMQWLGSRKPKSWSEKDQLDYIAATYNRFGGNEWLDKKAWKRFNETTDPAEAARLFRRYWERPERSSWNATDALFKNSKGSYLPQDVNDLVAQVSNLQYDEPKAPVFTEEDQRLLDTPALAFYNPEYEDTQAPDYKPSALLEAIKLDDGVWRDSNNPLNAYFALTGLMNNDAQLDNNYSWLDTMMTYSPRVTPQQREAADMYQLFNMTGDGGQLYHGLNFAAYGGRVNRFGLGGDEESVLPEVEVTGTAPKISFTGCVPAARHALAEYLGISDQGVGALYNLYGNAWDIANSAYMASLPFSQQSAQPGDLVVMSRPPLQSDEKRGIPTSNQHVGLIILTPDGLRVKHYTGGDKYNIDNLNSIMLNDTGLRYTPTTLLRIPLDSNTPEYTGLPGKTNGFVIQPFWGAGQKTAAEALNSLDLADEALLSNDEDFDLKLATMAALGVESDFGGSNRATARHFFPGLTNLVKSVKRGEPQLKSEGYISMKPNTYLQNTVYSDLQDAYTAGDLSRSELWKQTTQRTAQNALNPFSLWKGSPVGGTSPSSAARTMAYLGIDPQTLARSVGDDAKILYGALVNLRKKYPNLSAKELVEKYRGSKLPGKYDAIINSINEGIPYMDSWYNNLLQSINTGYDNVKNTLVDFGSRYTENIAKLLNDLHIPFTGANFRGIAADLAHRKDTFTEDDLSNREFNTLRDIARKEWLSGKKALDYSSYTEEGDIGSGGTSVPMKMVHGILKNIYDPAMSLQNLIGQGGLYVDDNGHLHVLDEYDFNNQGTKPSFFRSFIENPSPYGLIRSLGTVYGSAPGAGRKLDIDVGPVYSGGGGSW